MQTNKKTTLLALLVLLLGSKQASGISGTPFNSLTDIDWSEINFTIKGICICPRPPPVFFKVGLIFSYWEPFMLVDTSAEANYSAMFGSFVGSPLIRQLGGKNTSSDAANVSETTFAQAHGFLLPLMYNVCSRSDYGAWWSELDSMWQNDTLSALIHPEATLYANQASQMACMADAAAVNVGWPLDAMPWCVGSGGSAYPMTGHVDNDNIVQANSTVAARLIYKLNRIGMVCDAAPLCGCMWTPVWIKSHYKLNAARPGIRGVYPIGKAAKFYDSGLNPPYMGSLGSNDEFLWVVYRLQECCSCCE